MEELNVIIYQTFGLLGLLVSRIVGTFELKKVTQCTVLTKDGIKNHH